MELKHFYPLILFIVPTIIISIVLFVFVEAPGTATLIGFVILLVAACGTYYLGIWGALKDG